MSTHACLRFYVHESRKLRGVLLYEWLLEDAKRHGVHGGSAFRAIAGFGRHGQLHEQHFFELAGDLTVMVEFVLPAEAADAMLQRLAGERADVFYTRSVVDIGVTGAGV